ncbi:hypothetical protein A3E39_01210 [Candidatus Uhrbacteria bacterium RIFCSPHIGHO2_12_FULL_60_25]|uniref:FAD dependent oxidoreductase domain-containing protein n=1 Tax=Candidatus Uhrbacteria bacterium RIFCSPHIGHO2_12_FULL_60_25 TaxID=1802399 RepID=A0A1F7UKG0_9BACT|nr:MAG: hypothetical protein A3D73_02275 [Candidatus Uhrbacteria bacterium RIFCSPHIGHO2_02_FULL_60_44]OGL78762.1 MAG: hypothetical protein A3E39_01210 [Candidatus Uhrbacteria bacterium RIFCSPHIGHO2_12_FULL_60_25]
MDSTHELDVLVIGGGIAGLWLLDELRRAGYSALLVEKNALGTGQTAASQGILHGGFKHALTGRRDRHVSAFQHMPAVWKECLAGRREPDLSRAALRGDHCLCWRANSVGGVFGLMAARLGFSAQTAVIPREERPLPVKNCHGDVLRLNEQVVDPTSVVQVFAERNLRHIVHAEVVSVRRTGGARVTGVSIQQGTVTALLRPRTTILTAGEGNAELGDDFGVATPVMKRLPLSIMVVRGPLPDMNGFCIDGTRAKAVITTHREGPDAAVWQVACERATDPFQKSAWRELQDSLSGYPWPDVTLDAYRVNRAELPSSGTRADDVQMQEQDNVIAAWPTKFVLAPRLAERIMRRLPPPGIRADVTTEFRDWRRPDVAVFPWQRSP